MYISYINRYLCTCVYSYIHIYIYLYICWISSHILVEPTCSSHVLGETHIKSPHSCGNPQRSSHILVGTHIQFPHWVPTVLWSVTMGLGTTRQITCWLWIHAQGKGANFVLVQISASLRCRTYQYVLIYDVSNGWLHIKESCVKRMSVLHMSCLICKWLLSHIWMSPNHVSRMNESSLKYGWVMSRVSIGYITHMNVSCLIMYGRVMSHTCVEPRHQFVDGRVTAHIWMRHADYENLSANAKWPKQALQKAKTNTKH